MLHSCIFPSISYENIFQKGIQNNLLDNICSTCKHIKTCGRVQNSINTVGVLFTSPVWNIKLFTCTLQSLLSEGPSFQTALFFFEGMNFSKTFKCWQLIKCVLRKHTVQLQSKLKRVKNKNNLRVILLIYSPFQTNCSNLLSPFYQYRLFHGSGEAGHSLQFGLQLRSDPAKLRGSWGELSRCWHSMCGLGLPTHRSS